ncbi:MAG: alpha/beta hydrolase fold domain-containing protein [Clostridiales bacterium]|jgi:acetyl esterase/lipase/glyoxylase-like metal-dependent hydrolase (beta-lactamase superfamily II)|nr:alpha/beta hydrolase fold domain-containing protein [Clostridiales bacterium]
MRTFVEKLTNATLTGYIHGKSGEMPNVDIRPAVLVFPGGGYMFCSDREGEPVALAYLAEGYNTFVLRYSVGKNEPCQKAFEDANEAIAYLHNNEAELNIDKDKIAVIGFSAGGHLAAWLSVSGAVRPNAAVLGYPCVLKECGDTLGKEFPEIIGNVDKNTPPAFIFSTRNDDVVPIENSLKYINALAQAGVGFETHIYAKGTHGLSLAKPLTSSGGAVMVNEDAAGWFTLSVKWLKGIWGDFPADGTQPPNMNWFVSTPLNKYVVHICDKTGVAAFLVKGKERALLIDTCMGLGDIKAEVENLTKLPYEVALTHGHLDHVGGAGCFSKVCVNGNDVLLAKEHSSFEMRYESLKRGMPQGVELPENVVTPAFNGEFLPLNDGQVFDLGGVMVEAIALRGHTKGSMCFLIREQRAVLYGDACNVNTLIMDGNAENISAYRDNLIKFKERDGDYDTVYYSHGPAIGPRGCLDDNIELCVKILEGTDDAVQTEIFGQIMFRAAAADDNYRRLDGKHGNIVYNKANAF